MLRLCVRRRLQIIRMKRWGVVRHCVNRTKLWLLLLVLELLVVVLVLLLVLVLVLLVLVLVALLLVVIWCHVCVCSRELLCIRHWAVSHTWGRLNEARCQVQPPIKERGGRVSVGVCENRSLSHSLTITHSHSSALTTCSPCLVPKMSSTVEAGKQTMESRRRGRGKKQEVGCWRCAKAIKTTMAFFCILFWGGGGRLGEMQHKHTPSNGGKNSSSSQMTFRSSESMSMSPKPKLHTF